MLWCDAGWADVILSPHLRQYPGVVCHPIEAFRTYLNTQDFAMLPDAIFSTLQGTQNPDTNQTLQRAKNANTQPTHPS